MNSEKKRVPSWVLWLVIGILAVGGFVYWQVVVTEKSLKENIFGNIIGDRGGWIPQGKKP